MKYIYIGLGFLFFGLGAVGAALPVLPTVPFLLLSSFCFARGSERFSCWLKSTRLYQNHLDSFAKERAMTVKTKALIMGWATLMLLLAFLAMKNIYGRLFILLLIAFKYYYFLFKIRTIHEKKR